MLPGPWRSIVAALVAVLGPLSPLPSHAASNNLPPQSGWLILDVGARLRTRELGAVTNSFPLHQAPGASNALPPTEASRVIAHLGSDFRSDPARSSALEIALLIYLELRRLGHGLDGRDLRSSNEEAAVKVAIETNVLRPRGLVSSATPLPVRPQRNRRAVTLVALPLPARLKVVIANRPPSDDPKTRELYDREEERIARLLYGHLADQDFPVPPPLSPAEIERRLAGEKRIRATESGLVASSVADQPVLVVPVRLASRPLGIALELSGGYATDENLTAGGAIELKNLVSRVEDPGQRFDILSLHGRAGPQIQEAGLSWNIPLQPNPEHLTVSLDATGDYSRNRKTAFAPGTDARTDSDRWIAGAQLQAAWDSFSPIDHLRRSGLDPSRRRLQFLSHAQLGFTYDDSHIRTNLPGPPLPDGAAAIAVQRAGFTLDWDPHDPGQPGVGAVTFEALLNTEQGLGGVADDYAYQRWQTAASLSLHFGWVDSHDYLLRQSFALGSLHGDAPELHRFRLGGSQPVRGLQEGEFAGHAEVVLSSEFGFNLARLFRSPTRPRTPHPDPSDDSNPDSSPTADPPAHDPSTTRDWRTGLAQTLNGVYLKAVFDWARISPDSGLSSAWNRGDTVTGYGLFLEIPRQSIGGRWLSLNLGYAYSPDSRHHRSGLFVISSSFPF